MFSATLLLLHGPKTELLIPAGVSHISTNPCTEQNQGNNTNPFKSPYSKIE